MKSFYLLLSAVLFTAFSSFAQTNTFPDNGNVGIGTLTPANPLDVYTNTNGTTAIQFTNNNTGSLARTRFMIRNGVNTALINLNSSTYPTDPNSLSIWAPLAGGSLLFYTAAAERLRIDPSGKVGIGTTSPNTSLDINGAFCGGNANLDGINTGFLANSAKVLVGWNRISGAGETDFIANQGPGAVGGFAFYNHDNSNNEKQLMWLTGDGKLLVGVSTGNTGNYKLAVGGGVIAESVTVKLQANWPDYVFKKDYQLPSLTDVKTYINQNHHLPDMPSEAEVAKDGLNLGEMNKLLVKKVEELTLYLIEKDKEKKEQEAINQKNAQQMEQLKAQLESVMKLVNKTQPQILNK